LFFVIASITKSQYIYQQKKYQEALQVLQGSLSEKLANGMIENKKGEYLRQMKRWDQMLDYTEELLRSNPDQWSYYSLYMEALFELTSTTNADVIGRAKIFLLSLMEQERLKSENKLRGPYLAMLFFWQQLQQRNFDASTVFGNHTFAIASCLLVQL
jgi:tetratricopeptide (TPR) repeat protein